MRSLKDAVVINLGCTESEAISMIEDAARQVLEDGDDPGEVLLQDFGLDADYELELLEYCQMIGASDVGE